MTDGSPSSCTLRDSTGGAASIRIRRRIAWIDTDAAGIYHWLTAYRLAEEAEAALYTALGIAETMFGATPRLAADATFHRPLSFNDAVEVEFAVIRVGRSSIRQRFSIAGRDGVAADGAITTCFIDRSTRKARPLPERIRELLVAGGRRQPLL